MDDGQPQPPIRQVEAVEHLVVVIAGRAGRIAGERVGVGALEVDDAAALLVEELAVDGVVEVHAGVGGDVADGAPGAGHLGGLRVPDLAVPADVPLARIAGLVERFVAAMILASAWLVLPPIGV